MTLNKKLIKKLQSEANDLGVALALPEYIKRIDPRSQNHVVFAASQELVRMRHERGDNMNGMEDWSMEDCKAYSIVLEDISRNGVSSIAVLESAPNKVLVEFGRFLVELATNKEEVNI